MKFRLVLILSAVLFARHALAQSWTSISSDAYADQRLRSVRSFEWTTTLTPPAALDVGSLCGHEGSFTFDASVGDSSADAKADIRVCDSDTEPIGSNCTLLRSLSGASGSGGLNLSKRYLRVIPLAATTGGDVARIEFSCDSREGASAVSTLQGARDGLGNEATLSGIEGLPTSQPFMRHLVPVYFSADGGQTGSLTVEATASGGKETTFTTGATPHGMQVGDLVDITGTTSYNGRLAISAIGSPTTFTANRAFVANDATGTWTHVTGGRCPIDMPQGNDTTGNGTKAAPFRSLGRAAPLVKRGGVMIVLDGCDVWDRNDAGGSGDNESAAFPLTNSTITLDARTAGSDWKFCHDARKVCAAIVGSDPTGIWKPVIDPDMLDAAPTTALVVGGDDGPLDARKGWFHVENVVLGTATHPFPGSARCATDSDIFNFGANNPSLLSMLHVDGYVCGSANEIVTSHNDTNFPDLWVLVDVNCFIPQVGPDGQRPCFWQIADSQMAFIGGRAKFSHVSGTAGKQNYDVKVSPGSSDNYSSYGFVYDRFCDFSALSADTNTQPTCWVIGAGSVAGSKLQTLTVARSRAVGSGTGFANTGSALGFGGLGGFPPGGAQNLRLNDFRNSSYNFYQHASLGATDNQGGVQQELFKSRCSVHYKGPAGASPFFTNTGGASDCTNLDVDIKDALVDEADSFVGQIEGAAGTSISDFCTTLPSSRSCHGGAWTRCTMTDLTADPFTGSTGGAVGLPLTTQTDNDCTEDWVESFPNGGLYIPPHLTDGSTVLYGFRLLGVGQPIGP